MKKKLILFLISITLFFLQCCSTPFAPDVKEYADVEAEIQNEVNANNIPSLAALVVKEDSIVWQGYYGYADVASRKAAGKNTVYTLASVSKLIIVTAVMQLKEKGLINLDADINDYLPFEARNPNYPDDKITVYNLLTHTSGLNWPEGENDVPGYYHHYPLDTSPPLREWIPQFILPGGVHYVPAVWMNHPPGAREWYSNIGASLLAYIVEVVSGTDYNEYCKQNIFLPLEMFNTSHAYADLDMNNLATLYSRPNQSMQFYCTRSYPTGDLKCTIEDFSHFLIAYLNRGQYKGTRILEENTVKEILEIRNPASGLCLIWNFTLGNWYGHAGGKTGTSAYAEFQRDKNVALIIVTNYQHSTVYPGHKTHALVRRIAGRYY